MAAIFEQGVPAAAAILDAAAAQAELIAALDDPMLAERADDVRSVGRRAAALVGYRSAARTDSGGGRGRTRSSWRPISGRPRSRSWSAGVSAIALAAGGVSAHAAIVARSLGIPMVVGAGEALLELEQGGPMVVDGGAGTVVADPDAPTGRERGGVSSGASPPHAPGRWRTATYPRRRPTAAASPSSPTSPVPAELATALEAGAEGIGLLRTELAFLGAHAWPTEADHVRALAPIFWA